MKAKQQLKRQKGGKFAERAFQIDLEKAESGSIRHMSRVGISYLEADGTKQDVEVALFWLKKAATNNEPYALLTLGGMFLNGKNVEPDLILALDYLLWAAMADASQNRLMDGLRSDHRRELFNTISDCYRNGHGCAIDSVQADEWSQRAANVQAPVKDGSAERLLQELSEDADSDATRRAVVAWREKLESTRKG